MAKKGIIASAGDTIGEAAGGAASLAAGAANVVAKAATGTALKAVRGARRLVAVPKESRTPKRRSPKRRSPKRRSPKRRAAGRKAAVTRKVRKTAKVVKRRATRALNSARRTAASVRRKKR